MGEYVVGSQDVRNEPNRNLWPPALKDEADGQPAPPNPDPKLWLP